MKNRKSILVVFLVMAAMLMSVGYAALTDTLTIIGNAHIDMNAAGVSFDNRVYFSASEVVLSESTGTGAEADVVSHTSDDATFTANKLAVKGEKSTFKFTIQNDSNVPVQITIADQKLSGSDNPSNSNTAIFKVDYAYSLNDMTIPSGESMDVTVTVSVVNPVTSATSATFGIELTATSVELQ